MKTTRRPLVLIMLIIITTLFSACGDTATVDFISTVPNTFINCESQSTPSVNMELFSKGKINQIY
ncbi:MAG: hypothetical protein JG770_926 [Mahella sp.]|nr:hypothetical protein [Mahella sp.]MDK2992255.1 hypothetical protein [Clostridiales bacterium]